MVGVSGWFALLVTGREAGGDEVGESYKVLGCHLGRLWLFFFYLVSCLPVMVNHAEPF